MFFHIFQHAESCPNWNIITALETESCGKALFQGFPTMTRLPLIITFFQDPTENQ